MKIVYLSETDDLVPYAMSAVMIDEKDWRKSYDTFKSFRKNIKNVTGLRTEDPFCIPSLAGKGDEPLLTGTKGRMVLAAFSQILSSLPITIAGVVSKSGGSLRSDLRKRAFPVLMQRIERASDEGGGFRFVVVLNEDMDRDTRSLSRKLRVYNPLPGGANVPMTDLIEDSFVREQNTSHLLKSAELSAFMYRALYLFRSNHASDSSMLSDYTNIDREFVFRIFYVWYEKGVLMEKASLSNKYGMVTIR